MNAKLATLAKQVIEAARMQGLPRSPWRRAHCAGRPQTLPWPSRALPTRG